MMTTLDMDQIAVIHTSSSMLHSCDNGKHWTSLNSLSYYLYNVPLHRFQTKSRELESGIQSGVTLICGAQSIIPLTCTHLRGARFE